MKSLLSVFLITLCVEATAQTDTTTIYLPHKQLDSTIKNLAPIPGKAIVYILRPDIHGALLKYRFDVDTFMMGWLGIRSYLYTILDPGVHVFKAIMESDLKLTSTLEAGKIYFMQLDVRLSFRHPSPWFTLYKEEDARKDLRKCSLSKYNSYPDFPRVKLRMFEP
ncbi:hypothetical protein [Dinghuibacter silviterrae]|uniref:DUF2846 domain-containing protein n=1 Tax=Dinghuibacter silviterrae TaxID=1539049 RepID=A0A4R8DE80_9BACT|nr:hypothetical protein [Dinghuibacter silviterrae]TDW95819.1 hypothetical protein EDB95_3633 [Dinghuibacter silviterrae]